MELDAVHRPVLTCCSPTVIILMCHDTQYGREIGIILGEAHHVLKNTAGKTEEGSTREIMQRKNAPFRLGRCLLRTRKQSRFLRWR